MEDLGIIQRSKSPWASPLHIVPKKDGGFRPCGDYRQLNVVTEADKYPIPYLHDATNFLRGKTIFSKVDLVKLYYQIPINSYNVFLIWKRLDLEDNQAGRSTLFINSQY